MIDQTKPAQNALVDEMFERIDTLKQLDLIHKLNPTFKQDGDKYCYLYGENLQAGVAGFGNTAAEAMSDFCRAFYNDET